MMFCSTLQTAYKQVQANIYIHRLKVVVQGELLLISPHSLAIIVCFVKPSWFKSIVHAAIPEAACFYSTLTKPEL